MSKTNNIIEINGKQYDARTGAALGVRPAAKTRPVDGISKPHPAKPAAHHAAPAPKHKTPTVTPPKAPLASRRLQAKSAKRQTQTSRTLMRQTVHKPAPGLKRHLKAQSHTGHNLTVRPVDGFTAPAAVRDHLAAKRLRHAQRIHKSQAISRFSQNQFVPASDIIAVKPKPAAVSASKHAAATTRPHATVQPQHKTPPTTTDILQRALDKATSHEQPAYKPKRRGRRIGVLSVGFLSLALIAFVVIQNATNVKLQFASAKTGFSTNLPTYQPAGDHLGDLTYGPGTMTAHYQTGGGQTAYTLTEKSSDWDSQTLLSGFVAGQDSHYQTTQSSGRTIYLYGNGQATWVDSGVWYQIASSGGLNNQQLVKLASTIG